MDRSTLAGLLVVAVGLALLGIVELPAGLAWWMGSCFSLAGVAFAISAAINAYVDRERR
jgi:hypothetical protein